MKLYVDDKETGPLPQELRDLTPGDHVIDVAGSDRYQPLEKHVSVERQKIQDLGTVTLKVLKGKATISLGTPGARVFLVSGSDRRELPMLPISVDIDTAKSWALEAQPPRVHGLPRVHRVRRRPGRAHYTVSLDPRPAGGGGDYRPRRQPAAGLGPAPAPSPRSASGERRVGEEGAS